MADEQTAADGDEEQKPSGGMMKMMTMGLGMFVIVLAAQTVAPLITNKLGIAPAPVIVQADGEAGDGADAPADDGPPLYWPLKPALIVNFTSNGESSFLQVEMEVMTRKQATVDAVKEHTPALRDALLMLLAAQDESTIFSTEGKEALRARALTELNRVLEPYVDGPGLEAVYFTSFVAQ